MTLAILDIRYDPGVVMLSCVIAVFASYVALDLANRVRTQDRTLAKAWWLGGSVAMGSGIWSMHFVGMLAAKLPFAAGYSYQATALSWLAAAAASAVALQVASREKLTAMHLIAGAIVMGAGICVMHYTGMAALELTLPVFWNYELVATSAVIAVAASTVALVIFFWLRRLRGAAARRWQLASALVMGAAISGMHYTGMAAAAFPVGTVCTSANELSGDSLGLLVSLVAITMLSLVLFVSAMDDRAQSKTAKLAASLQTANLELQQLAFRDGLTGLANRLLFDDRVDAAVVRSQRDGRMLAVLFVDLDGFKPINDSFGHAFGDGVLREVARRIAAQARNTDTVARVGGDEFVLLLEHGLDTAAAAQVAQRVIDAVKEPVVEANHEVRLSCSVGIAMFPSDGPRELLMTRADAAMYAAKRAGGTSYAFFEPHMNAGVRDQIEMQNELRHALEHGEIELHYQPKINTTTGVVTGAEALARWRHPVRGMVSPGVFIPIAERFGLINQLGNWVLEEACRQERAWLDAGLRIRVSINLSVHQLRMGDLSQRVEDALKRHDLEASLLTCEITESVAMEDTESTKQSFERLRQLGVRLSIDDFGTGYSSLSYLGRLKATELKIDRSFVKDLETSAEARAIVTAIVQLAHALSLKVVAEGVETVGQQAVLTSLDCDELQGFLFAKPMSAQGVADCAIDRRDDRSLKFGPSTFVDL